MGTSVKKSATASKIKKLLRANDLIYVTEDQLNIERRKKNGGFYYTNRGHKISNKKRLERFKNLVIPPAWKEVKICSSKNGHLQVVGRDDKSRKVYRYHPVWTDLQKRASFFACTILGKNYQKSENRSQKIWKCRGCHSEKFWHWCFN